MCSRCCDLQRRSGNHFREPPWILVQASAGISGHFATRHGRIQIIECEEIKYLCKEHLGLDVLISLPKPLPLRR